MELKIMEFKCKGHVNMRGTHARTLEFTKDDKLSLNGDCIIGVSADFELEDMKSILNAERLKVMISVKVPESEEVIKDEIVCNVNPVFNDNNEIVIRIGEFDSKRTLGVRADKAAIDINRKIIEMMKNPETIMNVVIKELEKSEAENHTYI